MRDPNEAAWIAIQAGCCPLLKDLPGMGKTSIIQQFAKASGRKLYTLIGSIREPADIGGFPFPVQHTFDDALVDPNSNGHANRSSVLVKDPETGRKTAVEIQLVPPRWAIDCHDGNDWVIVFDELTTCPPAVQAAMLRIIAERVVGDLPIPKDTWLVAACNPAGIAANGFDLEPPMANRMVHLDWKFPWDSYREGLMNGLEFPEPEFPLLPENWRDSIPEVASLVAAYCSSFEEKFHLPTDENGNPTAERSRLSRAYPSPRSWEYLVRCLAAAKSVHAPFEVESALVNGCVGPGVGIEFLSWRENLDIPNPEDVLTWLINERKGKRNGNWPGTDSAEFVHPKRTDHLIAMLSSVVERVVGDTSDKTRFNESRWRACYDLIVLASKRQRDVATSVSRRLMRDRDYTWDMGEEAIELFHGIGMRKIAGAKPVPAR